MRVMRENEKNIEDKCIICTSTRLEGLKTTKIEAFAAGRNNCFKKEGRKIERIICKDCGTIQFLRNEDYMHAVDGICENYEVMLDKTWLLNQEMHKPRLQANYEAISKIIHLPKSGNMLDIGCGGGESLFQFSCLYPDWNLYGMDKGKHFRESVLEKKATQFFTSLEEIKDSKIRFDFITINSVISLADNPDQILKTAHECLNEEGILFISDIDFEIHPWMLYLIEWRSSYTKEHMKNVVRNFGFEALNINFELEKKEIGVFFQKRVSRALSRGSYERNKEIYCKKIEYLDFVIDTVLKYVEESNHIGIFGTSVAGIWVSEIITKEFPNHTDKEIFYIEEDEDFLKKRVGVKGYPIYRLEEISEPAIILLPFPQYIAENIKRRCERVYSNLKFIIFNSSN